MTSDRLFYRLLILHQCTIIVNSEANEPDTHAYFNETYALSLFLDFELYSFYVVSKYLIASLFIGVSNGFLQSE